ncbi:hypothetical protein GTX53_18840 [Streptomyces sp. SID5594]|uniref:hypothetical protein n=1 Tax=Streptomyces TaxID=1883 RepID=UPI00131A2ABF|nr:MULTISPECIES: hypothetical protein [unclassified Streptomyces]MZF55863.1 hypothetical protein [Streptomyces sp. SID5594]
MAASRDFTTSRFEYRTYKVGRSLLDRVFAVASEGAEGDMVEFSTNRNGTTLQRSSLEELVSAVAASPTPGDPEIWTNLDFSYRDGRRNVSIQIHEMWLSVSVRGEDATWVHGQAARMRALLDPVAGEEPPWEKQHRTAVRIAASSAIVALVAAFLTFSEVNDNAGAGKNALDSFTISAFVFAVFVILGTQGKSKPKTFLNVVGEVSDAGWWKGLDTMERVAFGGLLVTFAAAIGTLASAYSDLWGAK